MEYPINLKHLDGFIVRFISRNEGTVIKRNKQYKKVSTPKMDK